MTRTRTLLVALVATMLLGACGSDPKPQPDAVGTEPTSTPQAADVPELPDGWRWEGFGGVVVGVPAEWGWGNASMRLGQWCIGEPPFPPIVGRPGASTAVGCRTREDGLDPSTLLKNTGRVVALGWAFEPVKKTAEGDQEVMVLGDVLVRVNAPKRLREAILATVHRADVDANGCPMHLPDRFGPGDPPSSVQDVATLTGVTSLAACRYPIPLSFDEPADEDPAPMALFSSLSLSGSDAQEVVSAFAAAPRGGGPDNPDDCSPDFSYGDEMQVVFIDSDQGRSVVHVYFSGCDHNGIDDGTGIRALTRDAVQPLIAGANVLFGWSGREAKSAILSD